MDEMQVFLHAQYIQRSYIEPPGSYIPTPVAEMYELFKNDPAFVDAGFENFAVRVAHFLNSPTNKKIATRAAYRIRRRINGDPFTKWTPATECLAAKASTLNASLPPLGGGALSSESVDGDDVGTVPINVRVPPHKRKAWKLAAASAGMTLRQWLVEACDAALARGVDPDSEGD